MDFEKLLSQLKPSGAKVLAVAAAEDDVVLKAVCEAARRGFVRPVLFGDASRINALAVETGLDLSSCEIVDRQAPLDAARAAVSFVREGRADILMKGQLQTADILRAVLDKENGVRGSGILSHVTVVHSPVLDRTLLLTDAAMVTYPDLKTKVELIKNALLVAHGLGIPTPKVAPLAAVETVNPDMPATLDAAALSVMNKRGQIKGCVIDGPLAFDVAVSAEAARHKGLESEVVGKADVLLFHNIEAANSTYKCFVYAGNSLLGGLVMGAKCPVVVTSRSDSEQSKLYSIACAACL